MSSSLDSTFRVCGPNFTTAIAERLLRVGDKRLLRDEDDDDVEYTEDQDDTHTELVNTVREHLLKGVDRSSHQHGPTFRAQYDAWSICLRGRTVIPLQRFKERGDKLEDWPKDEALYPADLLFQVPSVTRGVLIGIVNHIGPQYLNSYKGHDDSGDSGWLHSKIDWILSGRETRIGVLEDVLRALQYRMTQMSIADTYLEMMGIAPPDGQSCCEYDARRNAKEIDAKKYSRMRRAIFDTKILFPRPVASQSRPFYKGMEYLIGAFHLAGTPEDVVIKKLDILVNVVDHYLEQEKLRAMRNPEVAAKRRMLFHSFGIALGSVSPESLSLPEWA